MFTKMEPQRRCHLFETGKQRAEGSVQGRCVLGWVSQTEEEQGKRLRGKTGIVEKYVLGPGC